MVKKIEKETTASSALEVLHEIQQEVNVPKSEYNKFGKFPFRTAEAILAAIKPILKKYGGVIGTDTQIVQVGDRYYVEAEVYLECFGERISTKVQAREAEKKSGSDPAQTSGATITYARKYGLQNLFAIDDGEHEIDRENNTNTLERRENRLSEQKKATKKVAVDSNSITPAQIKIIEKAARSNGIEIEEIEEKLLGGNKLSKLPKGSVAKMLKWITNERKKREEEKEAAKNDALTKEDYEEVFGGTVNE